MTELPELPPLSDRRRAMPEAGLQAAIFSGRARRNRFLSTTAAVTAGVAVAGTLVLGGGNGEDALVASPEPQASTSVSQEPSGAGEPSPSAISEPSTEASGQPSGGPGQSAPSSQPEPSTEPEPQPEPEPGPGEPGADDPEPATEREDFVEEPRESDATTCPPSTDSVQAPNFSSATGCGYGSASSGSVRRGGEVQAYFTICVGTGGNPLRLGFDGGREHEVRVFPDGLLVYQFSQTVNYTQGPHERVIRGGKCLTWTGRWDATFTDGRDAPLGTYHVRHSIEPQAANGQRTRPEDGGSIEFDVEVRE